jgi:conjugative transfer signal peptidase TraF
MRDQGGRGRTITLADPRYGCSNGAPTDLLANGCSELVTQSVFVLSLAQVSSLVGVALIARSTSMRTRRLRILRSCGFGGVIVLIVYAIAAIDLHFNFTPSMPLGIYRLMPLSNSGAQRGMYVALCAPPVAAELGRRRGYVAAGRCPTATEPLLKVVVAVAGDSVTVSANGVAVNGCLLPHSRALSRDAAGRRLLPWPEGHFQLRRGELWLYAPNDRSWDSRYWGPGEAALVRARVFPLLVVRLDFALPTAAVLGCRRARPARVLAPFQNRSV